MTRRIDPNSGYVVGNVVPCCKSCNWAKGPKTAVEFAMWIRSAYSNWAVAFGV